MDIIGEWTINFDWGGSGKYTTDVIVFNSDGTFMIPSERTTGRWLQLDDMIIWHYDDFDSLKTAYAGNISKDMMSGTMGEFNNGDTGRWYAFKRARMMDAKEGKPEFNTAGKRLTYK